MANEPANPNYANSVATGTDTSIVNSLTAGGASYFVPTETPLVTSNSHPVVARADGALWDVTAGAYVSIQNTNCGTVAFPKMGQ
jgi:hypothetical protein